MVPSRPDGIFATVDSAESELLDVPCALDLGVNYVDTCTGYGASESVIGELAASRRKEMFLATKCDKCFVPGDQLRREREQSLKLLSFNATDQAGGGHGKQVVKDHPSIGRIAMKVFAGDRAAIVHRAKLGAETVLRYVLTHGFATAIVGMHTLEQLEQNVRIVRNLQPCSKEELREIERRIVGASPLRALTA